MRRLLPPLLMLCLVLPAPGDIVHLQDGSQVEGIIHKTDDGYAVTTSTGAVTNVPADKVASIEIKPASSPEASMSRLASLRRAVENLSDINQILDRYQYFIQQNAGTPGEAAARADMTHWQQVQVQGLVKVGSRWVTTEEQAQIQQQGNTTAIALAQIIKDGRLKEAGATLDKALADNPQNPALLYLSGVVHYREEELPASRKAFEAVGMVAQDHAPTLNNIAVILWRQNATMAALNEYDKAMLAAPLSREILDNVAEALNALPEKQRKSQIVDKVVRHFKEQDDELQKKLAERGLVRWGATWVTQAQADKLQEQEKEIHQQLDQMSHDFDSVQARINQIDRTIAADQQEMNLIDSSTLVQDSSGKIVRLPYPQRYYDLANEITALQAERPTRLAEQDRLRRNAQAVQQRLPVPRYTGIQKIIDVDGMPLPAPPASQPAAPQ